MAASLARHIRNNVVGYIALVVALSGVAYASHEDIRSSDIVNDQVKSVDVRDDDRNGGGLTASDLRKDSVRSSEVDNNSLTGADINETTLGVLRTTTVRSVKGTGALHPECNPGEVATGGGYTQVDGTVIQFRPAQTSGTPTGWSVAQTNAADSFAAYVICART